MNNTKKATSQNLTGPNQKTIKQLFARSGNRCAFPKCQVEIVQNETVVGQICHIKAAKPDGPRYDAQQTAAERHDYDNLILCCPNHHTVIDNDLEAYTVERLINMKRDHEQGTSSMKNDQAERGAQLIIDQSVTTLNQSGGITAHTIHTINVLGNRSIEASPVGTSHPAFPAAEPKDGNARFRAPGEPIGINWDPNPFRSDGANDIFLSNGPAMWLRLMPIVDPATTWSAQALKDCAISGGTLNLEPFYGDNFYLRAEDGFGVYSPTEQGASETNSVAFAFETGEIWSIDINLLGRDPGHPCLSFEEIEKQYTKRLKNYTSFLQCLGIEAPYRWICGLEGMKNRELIIPPLPGHVNMFPGPPCLADVVTTKGTYDSDDPEQTPSTALRPFFDLIFRKCGIQRPGHLNR